MSLLTPAAAAVARDCVSTEETLVRQAAAMHAAAWDALFEAHYGAIHRYAFLRLGDAAAADDVASEVFLQAVRGISRYRYRGVAFRAWLYRIAHNVVADARAALSRNADGAAVSTSDPDFAPAVLARRDLNEALAKLTDDQQQVIVLRFIEGLSIADTAHAMSRPPGAVKALQHRALNRMRRILEGAA